MPTKFWCSMRARLWAEGRTGISSKPVRPIKKLLNPRWMRRRRPSERERNHGPGAPGRRTRRWAREWRCPYSKVHGLCGLKQATAESIAPRAAQTGPDPDFDRDLDRFDGVGAQDFG